MPWTLARWSTLGMLEPARATSELALAAVMSPLVAPRASKPRTVVLVPGLSGGPRSTILLAAYLTSLGHHVVNPGWRRNLGTLAQVRYRWGELVVDRASRERPVTLVGWSIGGCVTRQVACDHPEAVEQVVTLGTPLSPRWFPAGPAGLAAARSLPVPCTAVYSRSDGIFDWRDCVQPDGPGVENVEVISSHLGLASNVMVLGVIAGRLA